MCSPPGATYVVIGRRLFAATPESDKESKEEMS
jgi:hypothetical protein